MVVREEEYKGYNIQVEYDEFPLNPREECDNLGTMVCFHNRYNLGDKHDFSLEEARKYEDREDWICLPLYLYDHSGITMNTTGFHCPWDSGQVGFIYVSKEDVRNEYGWKRLTQERIKRIEGYLRNEVEEYDYYLRGECYMFDVKKDGEDVDFNGFGFSDVDECIRCAKSQIDCMVREK